LPFTGGGIVAKSALAVAGEDGVKKAEAVDTQATNTIDEENFILEEGVVEIE
jgi:hypothetical protein